MVVGGGLAYVVVAAVLLGAPLLWILWWMAADATKGQDRRRPAPF